MQPKDCKAYVHNSFMCFDFSIEKTAEIHHVNVILYHHNLMNNINSAAYISRFSRFEKGMYMLYKAVYEYYLPS